MCGSEECSSTAATRCALKEVSVVASEEPSELVAFVSCRANVGVVMVDELRAHCLGNLTPAYVPKFFVIIDELPKLPNGKRNLAELKSIATQHVLEEGDSVMDSFDFMKNLSMGAILERQVIHRCYAFWILGKLTDHYMRCARDQIQLDHAFCTILARESVPPWSEILIRSFGNDQTLYGFVMLGAYQDARPSALAGGLV